MRINPTLLAGAVGLALAAGAPASSLAEGPTKSWGTKTTTYWSSDSTGQHEPGKFMEPPAQPAAMQPLSPAAPQRMDNAAPAKRVVRAKMRPRQQPPASVKPAAPPSKGEPTESQQPATPGAAPK